MGNPSYACKQLILTRLLMAFVLSGLCLVCSPPLVQAAEMPMIPSCELVPIDEAQVPAQEAGVLTKILVREGDAATVGQLLAQIDDAIPRAQQDVAKYKLEVAKRQADDDVDVRFATAAAAVAKAEYQEAMESNEKTPGTFPRAEVRKRLLDWHKMELSIEKAKKDMAVAGWQAKVAGAELNAAAANVARRRIEAPLDAVVVELTQHVGQWVQMGEPVMRLVRMDRLRINGVLDAGKYRPSEIQDRPVRVEVMIPHIGSQVFAGKIVYVKPLIENGDLQVRAEVQNHQQDGVWVLNPGMNAKMTIELK